MRYIYTKNGYKMVDSWKQEVGIIIRESGKDIKKVADDVGLSKRTIENWLYYKVEPNDFVKKAFRKEMSKLQDEKWEEEKRKNNDEQL